MNCANHADASAVAYCRTCGKALCANCTRPVRGVIYCEDCLGAKMEGAAASAAVPPASPQTPYQQFMDQGLGLKVAPGPTSGPNPTVAGILAGFFPVGVGAVYTGQYAKGLAHLAIMAVLIAAISSGGHGAAMDVILAVSIGFFYFYQIIDSVRSAKAIQMSQPVPDPFGLSAAFTGATKVDTGGVPRGAVVLIAVGLFFLVSTTGLFDFSFHRFWPLILILLGGWMFAVRRGLVGGQKGCPCQRCRAQCMMGPAVLVTLGVIGLLDSFHEVGFFGYVGGILLVVGGVKLLQGTSSMEGHIPGLEGCRTPAGGPVPPTPPIAPASPVSPVPPTSEVNRG